MVNLSKKGATISLSKAASDSGIANLKRLVVGLNWNTNKYDGGYDFDLDTSVFLRGEDGKVRSEAGFVFYGNLKAPGVEHMGDNKSGGKGTSEWGDSENIVIDLSQIDPNDKYITFVTTIHMAAQRNQRFGMVEDANVRIMDADTGIEIIHVDITEDFSVETALVVGELYRHDGGWKFKNISSGYEVGLEKICADYGLQVEAATS